MTITRLLVGRRLRLSPRRPRLQRRNPNAHGQQIHTGTVQRNQRRPGISAPGGLVNLLVKRPEVAFGLPSQHGPAPTASKWLQTYLIDLVPHKSLFAHQRCTRTPQPEVRNTKGQRHLLALAGDWRVSHRRH